MRRRDLIVGGVAAGLGLRPAARAQSDKNYRLGVPGLDLPQLLLAQADEVIE